MENQSSNLRKKIFLSIPQKKILQFEGVTTRWQWYINQSPQNLPRWKWKVEKWVLSSQNYVEILVWNEVLATWLSRYASDIIRRKKTNTSIKIAKLHWEPTRSPVIFQGFYVDYLISSSEKFHHYYFVFTDEDSGAQRNWVTCCDGQTGLKKNRNLEKPYAWLCLCLKSVSTIPVHWVGKPAPVHRLARCSAEGELISCLGVGTCLTLALDVSCWC